MRFFLLGMLAILTCSQLTGQENSTFKDIKLQEDTLGVLSYAMVNNKDAEQRFLACRAFIPMLIKTLKTRNSFDYKFDRLRSISILYAPDSSFRIFSWQLYVDTSEYRYFGAIQMNEPELNLTPLIDRSFNVQDLENAELPSDNWYGALYYNIKAFDTPEGKKYLLFGFDGFQFFIKRKVIDVLHFKEGKPVFGAAVFAHANEPNRPPLKKNRVVLEYSAEASVKCNYDEFEEMVIFDHLMPMKSHFPGIKTVHVPDGTYEGYKFANGYWQHINKVFNYSISEPPMENSILDGRLKDILGKDPEKGKGKG